MKIEHVAYMVSDPAAVARWYVQHLGLAVVRKMEQSPFTHFLTDDGGHVAVEIYNNPSVQVPDYANMDPLLLHLAFVCPDVTAQRRKMLDAGCTIQADVTVTPAGDHLLMMRDPWGFAIQFCKRETRIV